MEIDKFLEEYKGFHLRTRLEKLKLSGFRGFKEEIELDFDSKLTVFIGENGSGKTSILDAISELLVRIPNELLGQETYPSYTSDDINDELGDKPAFMELQMRLDFPWVQDVIDEKDSEELGEQILVESWDEARDYRFAHQYSIQVRPDGELDVSGYIDEDYIEGQLELVSTFSDSFKRWLRKDKPMSIPIMAYYTISRVGTTDDRNNQVQSIDILANYRNNELSNSSFSFSKLENWLALQYIMKLQGKERQSRIYQEVEKAVLEAMSDDFGEYHHIEVEWDEKRPDGQVIFVKGNSRLKYAQMSSGEKVFIALIADISRQLAISHPYAQDPLKEGTGVVLIDEIGLHLHPKWQKRVIGKLQDIFPNLQFIVTTHSPFIVQESLDESIIFLTRNENGNTIAIDKHFEGELSHSALIREAFQIKNPFSTEVEAQINKLKKDKIESIKAGDFTKGFKESVIKLSAEGPELEVIVKREIRWLENKLQKQLLL